MNIPKDVFFSSEIADLQRMVTNHGDRTVVNGRTVSATWSEAQPGRIQMYLAEDFWQQPVYEVVFKFNILLSPWSLTHGSEVTWQKMGWKGVVRHLTVDTDSDAGVTVAALVVLGEKE